jgi:hypothetical protein
VRRAGKFDSLYAMADTASNKKEDYSDLTAEEYELLLFRGELAEAGRPGSVEFVLPLIDKRLQEIRAERERLGLPPSDFGKYGDAMRESEETLEEMSAQFKKDAPDLP